MPAASKIQHDTEILQQFIEIYCKGRHGVMRGQLCSDCHELLSYARRRREKCPFDPKPACRNCSVHCYDTAHRGRISAVMRYSAARYIRRSIVNRLIKIFGKFFR